MAHSLDRFTVTKQYGALDAYQIARMDAVVAQARASKEEAEALVPGVFSRSWDYLIGASSSVSALQTNAAAANTLYETLAAKRDRLANDPNASEADVLTMEGARYALSNEGAITTANQLSPGAFYEQVIEQTGEDVVEDVTNPFGVPWWMWLAGIGAVAALVLVPRRK